MGLRDWEPAKALGEAGDTITADGVFIIATVHIAFIEEESEAWGVESIKATDWQLALVDENSREFEPADGVADYVNRDDRFETEVLTSERLQVGQELIRNVVFDVPPNRTYTLKAHIESTGGTSIAEPRTEHMEVGTVEIPA